MLAWEASSLLRQDSVLFVPISPDRQDSVFLSSKW